MKGANFEGSHDRGRFENDRSEDFGFEVRGRGRHRHRHSGFDGPRGFGGPGGPGHGGPHHRGHRGRRARRGDIRVAILLLLSEEPRNGYSLMQEVEERSGGVWRPSPGSVYPALAQLEDEGLIKPTEESGGKVFSLTDEGKSNVDENRAKMGEPWKTVGEGASTELGELREASRTLSVATMQVAQTGSKDQLVAAKAIVEEARRSIYGLLASD